MDLTPAAPAAPPVVPATVPAPAPAAPPPRLCGLALASLLLAPPAVMLSWLTGLPAALCGTVALHRIAASGGRLYGRRLAWSGIGLAVLLMLLNLILICGAFRMHRVIERGRQRAQVEANRLADQAVAAAEDGNLNTARVLLDQLLERCWTRSWFRARVPEERLRGSAKLFEIYTQKKTAHDADEAVRRAAHGQRHQGWDDDD